MLREYFRRKMLNETKTPVLPTRVSLFPTASDTGFISEMMKGYTEIKAYGKGKTVKRTSHGHFMAHSLQQDTTSAALTIGYTVLHALILSNLFITVTSVLIPLRTIWNTVASFVVVNNCFSIIANKLI